MGFKYFDLLDEGASSARLLVASEMFTRWGKGVTPTDAAVDLERKLYCTKLYSHWEDDGVKSAVAMGGADWCMTFMAVIDAVPVEGTQRAYRYRISIIGDATRSGRDIPDAERMRDMLAEAIAVYGTGGFLVEAVHIDGWERLQANARR